MRPMVCCWLSGGTRCLSDIYLCDFQKKKKEKEKEKEKKKSSRVRRALHFHMLSNKPVID